ncbi:MAG: type II toxin-antitoxin system VapC family toxin [bacterium]
MIYVLDASAAIGIALGRSQAAFCADLLSKADWVIAPDLFVPEVTNAFWKYHQFENLPLDVCEEMLELTMALSDDFVESSGMYKEAFALACSTHHPVYDTLYLVLARRENGMLLTLDQKLQQLAKKHSVKVAEAD